MPNPLTTNHQPLTTHQRLACELTGAPPRDLLKVRATADSLVVIIHTGQKFIYDLAAIQAALERLAAGLGRFTDDFFAVPPEPEPTPSPEPVTPVRPAAPPARRKLSARKGTAK